MESLLTLHTLLDHARIGQLSGWKACAAVQYLRKLPTWEAVKSHESVL